MSVLFGYIPKQATAKTSGIDWLGMANAIGKHSAYPVLQDAIAEIAGSLFGDDPAGIRLVHGGMKTLWQVESKQSAPAKVTHAQPVAQMDMSAITQAVTANIMQALQDAGAIPDGNSADRKRDKAEVLRAKATAKL